MNRLSNFQVLDGPIDELLAPVEHHGGKRAGVIPRGIKKHLLLVGVVLAFRVFQVSNQLSPELWCYVFGGYPERIIDLILRDREAMLQLPYRSIGFVHLSQESASSYWRDTRIVCRIPIGRSRKSKFLD
jgi:hypothetical protein